MSIQELFQSITERLQTTASVKTVYGDPIEAQGRTIIPVARVGYGFGGGAGTRQKAKTAEQPDGGEGGGGGVRVNPIGVVEISRDETRFIPLRTTGKLAGALIVGLVLGIVLGRKRLKAAKL